MNHSQQEQEEQQSLNLSPVPAVVALVPVKKRQQGKTRLARHLAPYQRVALVRSMLNHVVTTLQQCQAIAQVIVLSPERDQLSASVQLIRDSGWDLNSSLSRAITQLRQQGVQKILILPADLACIEIADIDAVLAHATSSQLVIAPSDDGTGTNALLLDSSVLDRRVLDNSLLNNRVPFTLSYGSNSFHLHVQQAERLGLSHTIVRRSGLGFDMDTERDLYRHHEVFIDKCGGQI